MSASRASFDNVEAHAFLPTSAPADTEKPAPAAPAGARHARSCTFKAR
jgi:hypothetical protein